jgi:glycosyltransferase involved in cell wall biosynthesis
MHMVDFSRQKTSSGRRVVWLPLWPNKNIYAPIFNKLGEKNKDLDLIMIVPDGAKSYDAGERHFTLRYLPMREYKKLFIVDYLKKKQKKEEIDVTTTMRLVGLSAELSKLKPDIVITNMEYSLYTLQAAKYCKRHCVPLIVQSETKIISGMRKRVYMLFMRGFFTMFGKSVPVLSGWSDASKKFMVENFSGMTKAKIYSMPPGVDTDRFFYSKKKLGKKLKVLVVSRLAPYKRHEDILKAADYLRRQSDLDFEIGLLGTGPMKDRIDAQVKELELSKVVKFLPKTGFEEMRKVYSKYDVLVLASFNEAIGMVVPEAMACGTPVVISDTVGAATYVEDGKSGFIFKTFDSKDLASKILLFKDKKLVEKMGAYAARDVKKRFSVEKIAEEFEKIILIALNKK